MSILHIMLIITCEILQEIHHKTAERPNFISRLFSIPDIDSKEDFTDLLCNPCNLIPTNTKILYRCNNNNPNQLLILEALLINRGYYTVARRYEYYFRVVKTIFYERAQRVSKILFVPRENNIHIFKAPCNVLFII